ncbi:MAG: DNA polymerase III subunit delta [Pseudomonadales bacterium]|nr:DNA polymerase III subunit delta [Pseudomonadales bacterium]
MRLKPEQLRRQLQQETLPLYWLAGDEPLLMQESADMIRGHFRDQGFLEREVFSVDRAFNWEHVNAAYGNLSLFAERKILDIRLSSSKLDEDGKNALQAAIAESSSDVVILVSSPRLESGTLNTKWFKAIEAGGAFVQIWPVNRDGLPTWLEQRLLSAGIQADPDALQLLLDKIEGNLLAAMQEIEKLKLLANSDGSGPVRLDSKTVMQTVADSSRYNAFQLVDAALLGDVARTQKILAGLKAEETFPLVILGSITRELRSLLPMIEKRQSGQGVNAILQSSRVWFNRKQAVGSALNRLTIEDIWSLLDQAREIDQAIKGMSLANPWDELGILLARIAGKAPALTS